MASDATITYALSQETGLGLELCKMAMERAHNDVDKAKSVLTAGTQQTKRLTKDFGIVQALFDKESNAAAVTKITCSSEYVAGTKEFYDLAEDIATELTQYEHHLVVDGAIKRLEEDRKVKIDVRSHRFIRTNPTSLLTAYTHREKIGVIVETSVANAEAFDHKAFRLFSFDCAMHIAAFNPICINKGEIPADMREEAVKKIEKTLSRDSKPMNVWSAIIDGKLAKWSEQRSLLNQIFIKSDKETVTDIKKRISDKIGNEIAITRFARIELE